MLAATPPGLPLRHPACLLATWFGAGLLPRVPGTWGALAALPVGVVALSSLGWTILLALSVVLFFIGWWAAEIYISFAGIDDPGAVVVDEVVGQWLVLLAAAPDSPVDVVLAFLLFRFFDIVKPWPVSLADRRLAGGLGIMLDDVLAALYALGSFYLFNVFQ